MWIAGFGAGDSSAAGAHHTEDRPALGRSARADLPHPLGTRAGCGDRYQVESRRGDVAGGGVGTMASTAGVELDPRRIKMKPPRIHLGMLLGKKVFDSHNKFAGRIEEI